MKTNFKILKTLLLLALFSTSCGVQKKQKISYHDLQVLADDAQEDIEFQLDD